MSACCPFLLRKRMRSYGWTTFSRSVYPWEDIRVVSIFLPVMTSAAKNIRVQVCVWIKFFFFSHRQIHKGVIAGSYGKFDV